MQFVEGKTRVRVVWLQDCRPLTSLAAVLRFNVSRVIRRGLVKKVKTDGYEFPRFIRLVIQPDDGGEDFEVDPKNILEIL